MEEEKEFKGSAWNLAQAFMLEIRGSLMLATRYYISKRFDKAFPCLVAVKMRIEQFFNNDEVKEFNDVEKDMDVLIVNLNSFDGWVDEDKKMESLTNWKIKKGFESYNHLLMKALKKYNISIPEKEDEGMF